MENNQLIMMPYNGKNGILIYCKECGAEFEETANGYYLPIEFMEETKNRICSQCLINQGLLS